MLTSLLGLSYIGSTGAIIYNLARHKLLDDFDAEIRKLREYDFTYEPIKPSDMPTDCIVLAKVDPVLNTPISPLLPGGNES